MTYREGRDPREVAQELCEEAEREVVACEIAHQNALAAHMIQGFELDRARRVLGHLVEIERRSRALGKLADRTAEEGESEEVARARAEVVSAEERLAAAKAAVETCFDRKAEAANRLREARAELDRER